MTTAKTRTRKAKTPGKDIIPKGPCVGFGAVESLVWRARVASMPSPVYCVDPDAFEDAAAAFNSDVDDALAGRRARAEEYDREEQVIRGHRPVAVRPAPVEIPVAVVTVTPPESTGAFYHLNSDTGRLEATPMDEKSEKHMAEILRLHAEQDGTLDVPGLVEPPPVAPGPGTPEGPDDAA